MLRCLYSLGGILLLLITALTTLAQVPTMPALPTLDMPPATNATQSTTLDRTRFYDSVQLEPLRRLAINHNDHVKIMDSWARQSLRTITNDQKFRGSNYLFTALDMTFRPEVWEQENIIYIQAVPIRERLAALVGNQEARRIMQQGRVSPAFLSQPEVAQVLQQIGMDTRLTPSVNKVYGGLQAFEDLRISLRMVPPVDRDDVWHHLLELRANIPESATELKTKGHQTQPVRGYDTATSARIVLGIQDMAFGWQAGNADQVNRGVTALAEVLPTVQPQSYPSGFTRGLEVVYNRTAKGLMFSFLYAIALVLLLMVAVGVASSGQRLYRAGLIFYILAVTVHLLMMAARWWLAGRIPIQNQFESILGAALLGCLIGLGLELWKRNGIYAMAMSFVGVAAMVACYAAPFVFGKDLGENPGKVAGVLNDFWLYIHVQIVIASYALISAGFLLGLIYLLAKLWHWMNPLIAEDADFGSVQTQRRNLLEIFDAANVVCLQMAFWTLGIGIVCGAVWADHSWGRPWGWDPKETFALVTWIVYLIVVHLRFVTGAKRADWTAWLSIVGFAIMLFNWIGVNYFLVGLHSYA